MELYNHRLCISHSELTDGIVSASALQKMQSRGIVQRLRRACNGSCALYEVESLPVTYRAEVYRRYPDLRERAESRPFVDAIEPDGLAMQFYEDFVLGDGRHLTADKQAEYSNNCAVLNAFARLLERANSHRVRQSKARVNQREFWAKAAAALPRICDRWPNSLPSSPRRLMEKYAEYRREGYASMISGKYQNKNAAKVESEQQQAVMTMLLAHKNNLDNEQIAGYYNAAAGQFGWPEITAGAVGVWRGKLDLATAAGRRGRSNFRNERAMQVKRSRPTAPFLMWSLDGWTCELLFQKTETDRKGHTTTTYWNRLTLEVVLDPSCNYPIGYAVGTHETPALIAEALRDAARHSRELTGEMLRAGQIQCDHYGIKTMSDLYNVMGAKLVPARVKNAKAKPIEPYFGYLNKTYCQRCDNWSGFGVTTDPRRQPNSEALNMVRHSFPDEEGVRRQIDTMMRAERESKRPVFMEMLASLPAERRLPLSKESYLLHFGATTGLTNALEGCGLRPTLLGEKRAYDSFDVTFREHAGEKWSVRYDPDDLTEVLAVNADGSRRYMLREKYVQPMALADRREGDAAELAAVNRFNRQLEEHVTDTLALAYEATERLIAENPQQELLLGRLLLTDSRGRHKLPYARQRMGAKDIEAVEVETVGTTQPPRIVETARETEEDFDIF